MTVNDPALPAVNVVVAAEVMAGAVPIVIVVSDSAVPRLVPRRVW